MQHYQDVLQDRSGNAIAGAIITVTNHLDGLPAILYADYAGTVVLTSIVTDLDGSYSFYFSSGRYDFKFYKYGLLLKTQSDVFVDQSTALQDLSAPTGASLVGFQQTGTGTVARTVDAKQKESVSVLDFGADPTGVADSKAAFTLAAQRASYSQVIVPNGTYLLNTDVTTPCTWLMDAKAFTTGAGTLTPIGAAYTGCRVVKLSNGDAQWNKGTKIGTNSNWINTTFGPLEATSELSVTSRCGTYAIVGSSRASDFTTATPYANATIGITGLANNDSTTIPMTTYGGYYESHRQASASTAIGIEIDPVNFGSSISGNAYNPIPLGSTVALWLASGAEKSTIASSLALGIANNGATYNVGICVQSNSITGCDGTTGTGIAISLAKGHRQVWHSPNQTIVGEILSTAVNGTTPQKIEFTSTGLNLSPPTSAAYYIDETDQHKLYSAAGHLTIRLGTAGPYMSMISDASKININNASGNAFGISFGGTLAMSLAATAFYPEVTNTISLGANTLRFSTVYSGQVNLSQAAASVASGTISLGGTTATTVGATGAASALPAQPLGYMIAYAGTTQVKIPYYTA